MKFIQEEIGGVRLEDLIWFIGKMWWIEVPLVVIGGIGCYLEGLERVQYKEEL